jgi:hypothetical protein
MAITQNSKILVRSALQQNLPTLAQGEFGWAIDSLRLFIGNGNVANGAPFAGNTEIATILDIGLANTNQYSNTNVAAYLPSYTGNVNAAYYFGDGSHLTGIASGTVYSNTNVAAYLPIYAGNVNAAYYFGNGAFLTGVVASGANYSNTNVAAYLPTSNVIISLQDSIFGANASIAGANASIAGANASIHGANAAIATLQSEVYSNSNAAAYLPIYAGNVNAAYYFGNGSQLTGITAQLIFSTQTNVTTTYGNNVVYTNSSSKPAMEEVTLYVTNPGSATTVQMSSNINGNAGPSVYVSTSVTSYDSISFIVPAGGTFAVNLALITAASTSSLIYNISNWLEVK